MARISKRRVESIRLYWKNYLLQCAAATVTIFILLMLVSIHKKPIIIASIAASTFIVFTIPSYGPAHSRNIILGHLIGMFCGLFVAEIILPNVHQILIIYEFWYAFAVGLSIFLMVLTDTEHPPAAGTALGVVVLGFSIKLLFTILISIFFLAGVHYFFKDQIRDLSL